VRRRRLAAVIRVKMPSFDDILAAAERIRPYILHTPLLRSPVLDARLGGRLLVKAECLQPTGSFKVRGAYNRLLLMSADERAAGVIAWSAGNHGQALALAGRSLGVTVTIVMPSDAPRAKIEGTRRWGAEIILYDRLTESREEIGHGVAQRRGLVIVPPYDDPDVIAGQGTAGLEALMDAASLGERPTRMLCCTGGGGLIAGCALAAERLAPWLAVHPIEPVGYDDTARSICAGARTVNDVAAPSICDALMTATPGEIAFAINQPRLAEGVAVSDEEVRAAMLFALRELKILVEPGGAAALAAALFRPQLVRDTTTIVMVTGGNLDLSTLPSLLASDMPIG
ncbi:MAG: threonine/serine dehydratase, partial [Sphingomonas sp.]